MDPFFCIGNTLHHHFVVVSAIRSPIGEDSDLHVCVGATSQKRLRNVENTPEIQQTFFPRRFSSVFIGHVFA